MIDRDSPLISVILPAYNAESYIAEAIQSILRQSCPDFELLVINDGSTDGTLDIICRIAAADRRINVIDNERNLGLIASLNRGIALASGEFVARQDADDISHMDRFRRQIDYMRVNLDVGLLGTAMELIDSTGTPWQLYRQPETDSMIRFRLLFNNALVHTSVMFRRELVVRHCLQYDPYFPHVEDYDLWTRMLEFTKAHNLGEPLVRYRVVGGSISQKNTQEQAGSAHAIGNRQLRLLDENLRLPWRTKCLMLQTLMKHIWQPLEPFSHEEREVLPAMHAIATRAIDRFPVVDEHLRRLAERIRALVVPAARTSTMGFHGPSGD